jgi:hypothetical protein
MTRKLIAALGIALTLAPSLQAQTSNLGVGSFPAPGAPPTGLGVSPPVPPAGRAVPGAYLLASDPASIQAAMMVAGYQAKVETREGGEIVITGRISRTGYWIYFKNCDDAGRNCRSIRFRSGYIVDTPPTLEALNRSNADVRFMRAWIPEDGSPRMQMDLVMRADGIGRENFARYLAVWSELIGYWEEFLEV